MLGPVDAVERLREVGDRRQPVLLMPVFEGDRQLLLMFPEVVPEFDKLRPSLLMRLVRLAEAGKYNGSVLVPWREASKLRSFFM